MTITELSVFEVFNYRSEKKCYMLYPVYQRNMSSRFSCQPDASASDLQENCEEMLRPYFAWYFIIIF